MTVDARSPSPAQPKLSNSITAPLLLWLVMQLSALALSAARIPLAARWPEPAEAAAVQIMMVVQVITSAMLFPWLLRDRWCAVAIVLTAGPMLQLAVVLASAPPTVFLRAWAGVAAWLGMLAVWRWALPSRSLLLAVAGMNLLVIAGPLVAYFGAESSQAIAWGRYFPLPALLEMLEGRWSSLMWALLPLLIVPAFIRGKRMRGR